MLSSSTHGAWPAAGYMLACRSRVLSTGLGAPEPGTSWPPCDKNMGRDKQMPHPPSALNPRCLSLQASYDVASNINICWTEEDEDEEEEEEEEGEEGEQEEEEEEEPCHAPTPRTPQRPSFPSPRVPVVPQPQPVSRGLLSTTFQPNLSALHCIGGTRRGCVARVKGVSGGVSGVSGCFLVTDTAHVELRSGRV